MAKITLLYFEGCPNVEEARENLRKFLSDPVMKVKTWDEVRTDDPSCPAKWRGFPSPTVLIDGHDVVTGRESAEGEGACRLAGAPDVRKLMEGLLKYGELEPRR